MKRNLLFYPGFLGGPSLKRWLALVITALVAILVFGFIIFATKSMIAACPLC